MTTRINKAAGRQEEESEALLAQIALAAPAPSSLHERFRSLEVMLPSPNDN